MVEKLEPSIPKRLSESMDEHLKRFKVAKRGSKEVERLRQGLSVQGRETFDYLFGENGPRNNRVLNDWLTAGSTLFAYQSDLNYSQTAPMILKGLEGEGDYKAEVAITPLPNTGENALTFIGRERGKDGKVIDAATFCERIKVEELHEAYQKTLRRYVKSFEENLGRRTGRG